MFKTKKWPFILALCSALMLGAVSVLNTADSPSEQYLEQSLQRALVAFATARALNGVISVAQGTQLSLEPAGVGVSFSPGEILDPINDLIERFSWVMLAASSSLGVQQLMLKIGAWWPVTLLFTACLVLAVWGVWRGLWQQPVFRRVVGRLLLLSFVLRFAVPILTLGGELLYQQFMSAQFQQASVQLEKTREEIDLLNHSLQEKKEESRGLFSRLGSIAHEVGDWRANLKQYQIAASNATRSTLDLIVIFLFQTAVMPLIFVWALFAGARVWFRRLGEA